MMGFYKPGVPWLRAVGSGGLRTAQTAAGYNSLMRMRAAAKIAGTGSLVVFLFGLGWPARVNAQQKDQPRVRINVVNVCTPGAAETKEIRSALEMIPDKPALAGDFEVARGRSTLADSGVSRWVRLRHEFPPNSTFGSAQYSFSVEKGGITETLVVRVREPKKVVLVSIEDTVTAGDSKSVLATETPADRISVERFGEGSLVLARCPQVHQPEYDALFQRASALMRSYRAALGVRRVVSGELERLPAAPAASGSAR